MTKTDIYNRRKLFWIGLIALFTAGMSASLRATIAGDIKSDYLDALDLLNSGKMIAEALGVSFLGFAITLFISSPLLDTIGMKRMLALAATGFIAGSGLIATAPIFFDGSAVYSAIWAGMLLSGIGWGGVEATINPMTTALYPEEKTHRLNVLHAWWPAGIIVGGLLGVGLGSMGASWQLLILLVAIPAVIFAVMSIGTAFPKTERAEAGIPTSEMFKEVLRRPSFLIWFALMFMTAATELAPGQWVDIALSKVAGMRGILILVYVSGLMFVMRHFAGPLVHRLSNPGLLMLSSLLACLGLYMLSAATGPVSIFVAATIWGIGVCYMWPTMLASVAERFPRGGSWMIGLLGSAGALSIYFILPILGAVYDRAKIDAAGGADAFAGLTGGALDSVLITAASQSFKTVAVIPAILVVLFAAIWIFEKRKNTKQALEGGLK
ncbi:MAG: MFS transporter [Kordiimonadaceae bacterium]|nr:MFS transporter [Kordiimonadaceae bacterium]